MLINKEYLVRGYYGSSFMLPTVFILYQCNTCTYDARATFQSQPC